MPARLIRSLLIEPDLRASRVFAHVLGGAGEVVVTDAASYALEWLGAGQRFDVIVCAVMMRHLTGPEFYRRARWIDAATARRIIFVSGATEAREESAVRSLPNLLLPRAVLPEQLLRAVAVVTGAESPPGAAST